jgi:hypothetical protein
MDEIKLPTVVLIIVVSGVLWIAIVACHIIYGW